MIVILLDIEWTLNNIIMGIDHGIVSEYTQGGHIITELVVLNKKRKTPAVELISLGGTAITSILQH